MLEVRPCESDADFVEFYRIQLAAFNTGMTKVLKPSPTDESREKNIKKHIQSAKEPDVHYLKVIDTELGDKMIAGAKWRINENERTEEQIQPMLPVPGEDDNKAATDFMRYLNRVRRRFMNTKPFCFLHILVVDPSHQRRGAGAMLVKWGCAKADKCQLPCFLESSSAGKLLYQRCGFEPVHVEEFDISKYDPNLLGVEKNTAMLRGVRPRET